MEGFGVVEGFDGVPLCAVAEGAAVPEGDGEADADTETEGLGEGLAKMSSHKNSSPL